MQVVIEFSRVFTTKKASWLCPGRSLVGMKATEIFKERDFQVILNALYRQFVNQGL